MKKLLMLGLAFAASLFTAPAKADVDVRIGTGVPGVVIGTNRHHHPHHFHPPVRQRYYGPPVYYYPENVYRHRHKHYRGKHYHHYKQTRPPLPRHHLRHGQRPVPPPGAYARGHWGR